MLTSGRAFVQTMPGRAWGGDPDEYWPRREDRAERMKLVNFTRSGETRLGFIAGQQVIDPLAALAVDDVSSRAFFADTVAFIKSGDSGRRVAERLLQDGSKSARYALEAVQLSAPILPTTILCSGSNYREHNAEKANTPISGKEPEFFVMTADNVIGPGEPIIYDPSYTRKVDCETELGRASCRERV